MSTARPLCVLVVGDDAQRAAAEDALRAAFTDQLVVIGADTPYDARDAVPADHDVAVTVLLAGDHHVDDIVEELRDADDRLASTVVLLTDRDQHDDLARSLDADLIQAIVGLPWAPSSLALDVAALVTSWLGAHRPDDPRLAELRVERRTFELPRSDLLGDLELSEAEITQQLVVALDRALGRRPRLQLPAGTRLTHQGNSIDGVVVVLAGTVALDRSTVVGELRLHHATTGPVVGLLALAQQAQAFFTARATTDVEVTHISLSQLDLALRSEPEVGALLAAVAIRGLAQRLKRSEELQVEKVELNRELEAERTRLQSALRQLEEARLELVESARFATLGELAAGVAHELNNPVAALTRAASYLVEDVDRLLASHPAAEAVRPAVQASRTRPPMSTAQERAARGRLTEELGDRELARRLVTAGIVDADAAHELLDGTGRDGLEQLELAAGIGGAARNLEVASARIAELVASLRAYARPSAGPVNDVDIHATIEDALRLVSHRLGDTHVERVYGPLPPIRANPGELGQVWTNLVLNAAESLDGTGRVRVVTDVPDGDTVRVRIEDDGPGVPPEMRERIFEPRFTTKQGKVRYGLGLGLAITRRIVAAHDGTIELDSEPGHTVVTVRLPVAGPPDPPPQETPR